MAKHLYLIVMRDGFRWRPFHFTREDTDTFSTGWTLHVFGWLWWQFRVTMKA